MLDENLPTFFFKASAESVAHHSTIYLSQYGSELEPIYTLRKLDPARSASKNRYAVALFDSYNQEVIFAEVLIVLQFTQPTLSAEQIRQNGGIPPPPQPIMPTEFAVQLYNPEQQVPVKWKQGSWGGSGHWEFELPQETFRRPSGSVLDRSQNDPSVSEVTPKINFRWKKDGKLSKDLICVVSGKSTDLEGTRKRGHKEPDITIALFRNLREMTLYETNLHRVDVEDVKGMEVVLMLSAATIRDISYGNHKEVFNLSSGSRKNSSSGSQALSRPNTGGNAPPSIPPRQNIPNQNFDPRQHANSNPSYNPYQNSKPPRHEPQPPPADARTQWEIDAETKRLKKMVEAEEKKERKRQAEIERETERLRKQYAEEQRKAQKSHGRHHGHGPANPPQNYLAPQSYAPIQRPQSTPQYYSSGQQGMAKPPRQHHVPHAPQYASPPPPQQWSQPPAGAYFGGAGTLKPDDGKQLQARRRSFFGMFANSEEEAEKLRKKKSSLF